MSELEELIQFLQPSSRFDLKRFASMNIAQLTGSDEGCALICNNEDILKCLVKLFYDQEINTAKDAFRCIINISANETGVNSLLSYKDLNLIEEIIKCIEDKSFLHANSACGILANITRAPEHCLQVLLQLQSLKKLDILIDIFCQLEYNKRGADLHLLAPFFTNISQLAEGRKILLDDKKKIIERLIPFIDSNSSKGRRKSIIATIHNCCFDKEHHSWLLGDEIDLATRLVYPLAGPDNFTAEENDSLPLDLQYLEDDKKREDDPEVRKLLLEALMQLCQTKTCRNRLRDLNIYLILREHHKWEEDKYCIMYNEDIVNLIVRTEEEIGADDITTLSVPTDLIPKFKKMDESYLKDDPETTDDKT